MVVIEGVELRREARARQLGSDREASRGEAGVLTLPERARSGQRDEYGQVCDERLHHVERLGLAADGHVHVSAAHRGAPTSDPSGHAGDIAVSRTIRELLRLRTGERVRPGGRDGEAEARSGTHHSAPQPEQVTGQVLGRRHGYRRDLDHALADLRLHVRMADGLDDLVRAGSQSQRPRIEHHELFFDPHGVFGRRAERRRCPGEVLVTLVSAHAPSLA